MLAPALVLFLPQEQPSLASGRTGVSQKLTQLGDRSLVRNTPTCLPLILRQRQTSRAIFGITFPSWERLPNLPEAGTSPPGWSEVG